jgi:hypothetical protein
MKKLLLLSIAFSLAVPALADDLAPPNLLRVLPGDASAFVDIEKCDEDVKSDAFLVVFIAEKSSGPYQQIDRFRATLYKGFASHTTGYIGHLTNGKTYFFVVAKEI